MGNSLRCCLSCILPCGALDLIRIVHLNGYVEELTGRVTAGEVLKNYPDHVLSKPSAAAASRRILIVAPDSDLKRGSIYFLLPSSSLPPHERSTNHKYNASKKRDIVAAAPEKKQRRRRKVAEAEWQPHLDTISEDL